MRDYVFVLLGSLDWEEIVHETVVIFFLCMFTLLWFEISVYSHETWNTSDIRASIEASDKIDKSMSTRGGTHIKQDTKLRFKVSTETLKEPEMWRELCSIRVFKAWKSSQSLSLFRILFKTWILEISLDGIPHILIN